MQVFEYTDFSKNLSKVFDIALQDDVIIKNKDGNNYKLAPVTLKDKSPFEDVTGIKLNVTTQEIVEMIREGRAGI
jgi:hypothetical protein